MVERPYEYVNKEVYVRSYRGDTKERGLAVVKEVRDTRDSPITFGAYHKRYIRGLLGSRYIITVWYPARGEYRSYYHEHLVLEVKTE